MMFFSYFLFHHVSDLQNIGDDFRYVLDDVYVLLFVIHIILLSIYVNYIDSNIILLSI